MLGDPSLLRGAVPGEHLAERYLVERVIGQGAYGRVFLARDLVSQTPVALKEFIRNQGRSDSFVREVGILFEMAHPAIIRCHTLLVLGPFRYIVFEFLDGGSLRELLDGQADLRLLLALLLEAASGVAYAHRKGIVHRDLKPENILLQRAQDGLHAKVSDFGISVLGTSRGSNPVGSPAYMAPEQFQEQHDERVDIYALGILLYEILCGRRPFEGSPAFLMSCHIHSEIELPEWLPRPLARVIRKATSKRPERRFASVDGFCLALESALDPATWDILQNRWSHVSSQVHALAVSDQEILVLQDNECLRLSHQGRLVRRIQGVDGALCSGRYRALVSADRVQLEGPSLRRSLRGVSGPVALSHEGALAFLASGRPVCIDRSDHRRLLPPLGDPLCLGFVGPEQCLAVAYLSPSGPFLDINGQRLQLPEPIIAFHGNPEREELVARSAVHPERLFLLHNNQLWTRHLAAGTLSCDGDHFYGVTSEGQLASLNLPKDRVAITRWTSPLAAIGAGAHRLAWVDRAGTLGIEENLLDPSPRMAPPTSPGVGRCQPSPRTLNSIFQRSSGAAGRSATASSSRVPTSVTEARRFTGTTSPARRPSVGSVTSMGGSSSRWSGASSRANPTGSSRRTDELKNRNRTGSPTIRPSSWAGSSAADPSSMPNGATQSPETGGSRPGTAGAALSMPT